MGLTSFQCEEVLSFQGKVSFDNNQASEIYG